MIKKVIWSDESEEDLAMIAEFILRSWDESILNRFLSDLRRSVERIKKFPYMYPHSALWEEARRCHVNYHVSLFYDVEDDTLIILKVFANKLDPGVLYED